MNRPGGRCVRCGGSTHEGTVNFAPEMTPEQISKFFWECHHLGLCLDCYGEYRQERAKAGVRGPSAPDANAPTEHGETTKGE